MPSPSKYNAPQMIQLRSAYGAINYLELVFDSDQVAQYEAISDRDISVSYNTPDDIVSIDFDGAGSSYYIGWKYEEMTLWKITSDNNFKNIYLFFRKMKHKNFVIAVDFDGTIVNTNDWDNWEYPIILGLRDGAKEYIQKLHDDGHTIIIYTCRNGHNLGLCIDYLNENGVYYDLVNSNTPEHILRMKRDGRKIYADFYIDDHNIGGLPSWKEIYEIINKKSLE